MPSWDLNKTSEIEKTNPNWKLKPQNKHNRFIEDEADSNRKKETVRNQKDSKNEDEYGRVLFTAPGDEHEGEVTQLPCTKIYASS